jgi:hypothetical protein
MTEYPHPIWELRDRMDMELYQKIIDHPDNGPWKEGLPATSLMSNCASHGDGKRALELIVEDIVNASRRGAPIDIVQLAIRQTIEFRKMLVETQARTDGPVEGQIKSNDLKRKLKGKIHDQYLNEIFKSL